MINRRTSSPGLGEWLLVALTVFGVIFLFYKLYEFTILRTYMPPNLTIAGIDVGGLQEEEVVQALTDRYINAPVLIKHPNGTFELNPLDAEMQLDTTYMISQANYQRDQQDFWAGFWGFLINRPINLEMIELTATHRREALIEVLEIISSQMDVPPTPPQPVPQTLSFQYGEAGMHTNIEASLQNIENAMYRSVGREANLVVEPIEPERPDILLLARLLVNHVQSFDGIISIFIKDLESGKEIAYQSDVAMTGMDILKIPITVEAFRTLEGSLTISQTALIENTLLNADNLAANNLLHLVAGKNDDYLGAELTTQALQQMGLENSFMLTSYDTPLQRGMNTPETPANSRTDFATDINPAMQTTAEDIGVLLSMLYYCAEQDAGTLRLIYREELTQQECQMILNTMTQNKVGSLIEGGVPPDMVVAHRHGWINDTHGDAGIVYTPNGNFVIVMFAHKPGWLPWELSSPMLADIARATYNYFNFEDPYFSVSRVN